MNLNLYKTGRWIKIMHVDDHGRDRASYIAPDAHHTLQTQLNILNSNPHATNVRFQYVDSQYD